ncbi:MAG TPA: hypothetical protein VH598_09135, partial [Verrucomicrobiae bacterium]|nr:hypothetical protein [Verrucomicrobiae bacterium]
MTDRVHGFLIAAVAGLAAVSFSSASLSAQKTSAQKKDGNAFTASKTWYNQPDLQGIWQPVAKAVDNLEKGGFIKDPANGKIPYAPGGAAKRAQNAKNAKTADLVNKCYMPGVPRLMY